ncbi:carboxypeptidase regulatory-like domain-containing protein [Microbacterium tumbae]
MSLPPYLRRSVIAVAVSAALVGGGLPAVALAVPAPPSPAAFSGFSDKAELRADGRAVVAEERLTVVDGSAPSGSGRTYFVDSEGGDDASDGSSPAEAWRTFANVNGTVFEPGDRILLKAGGSWSAQGTGVAVEAYDYTTWSGGRGADVVGPDATALLAPRGSGTAGAPIVLSSYGDGAAPELNGRGVVNDVLQLSDQEHWDISNLEISNETPGFDPADFEPARDLGQLPGDENPATGDLRGIHVQAENAGTLRGYDIHDVFIRDVSGYTWSVSGAGLDRSKRTGGILFEGLKGDAETASQFEDVRVRDNYIANTSFANLVFKQFAGMGTSRYQDLAPGWGDRAAARAATDGTITEDPDWRPHTGIEISGNYLTNRDTEYGWDAMYLTSVRGATVEGNFIDGAGVSGIEMYYADDIVVQDNEVAELEGRTGAADSNGIDPDRGTSNILIQGNYVHESGEGILLCGFGFGTAVVRYNVIQDIDRNYINPHGDSGVNVVHNNLMVNTVRPIRNNTVGFFESSGSAASYLTAKNPHHVLNNVFLNAREDVAGAAFRTEFPGVRFEGNAYHGPGVVAPAADASAIEADPQLAGDVSDDIRNALIGSSSSPLIGAGSPVDLAEIVPGFDAAGDGEASASAVVADFFGVAPTTPPDVGATSYIPDAGRAFVSGTVSDADGRPVAGAVVSFSGGSVTTDVRGRYSFENAAGEYTLTASAEGYQDGDAVRLSLASREKRDVPLTLGATTATDGVVSGRVTSSGSGVAGATVDVVKAGETIATTTTGEDGTYAIEEVAAGDGYTVTAARRGYETASRTDVVVEAARTVTIDLVLRREAGATAYAIDETFDDEATGAFAETSDGALIGLTNEAAGSVTIVEDPDREGNKYLRIDKSSATRATLGLHNATELNLTGTVTIEARVQRSTTNGTPNQLAMYSYTESDWKPADPSASTNPAATLGFAGGKIMTHNVTGASTVRNVVDYAPGQWYTVRNVVDLDTGTFDFYVDDLETPVLSDQPLRTRVADLDRFLFFINGSNVGDLLIDYFRVNTGEPFAYGDTALAEVAVEAGGAEIALTSTGDGTGFAGEVDPFTDVVSVSASPRSGFAEVSIAGQEASDGTAVEVPLAAGESGEDVVETEIPVVVTADDGTSRTYRVVVSRVNPAQLSLLRDLSVDGFGLSPAFEPDRKGEGAPYTVTATLPASVSTVTVSWSRGWQGQGVAVGDEPPSVEATSAVVALHDGENRIAVTASSVTGETSDYVLVIERAALVPQVTLSAEEVRAGEEITITVAGLRPGETADAVLHSEPVPMGALMADDDGFALLTWTVPASTPAGEHEIVLTRESGEQLRAPVTILAAGGGAADPGPGTADPDADSPSEGGDGLATTGPDAAGILALAGLGVLLLAAGVAFRQRRRTR